MRARPILLSALGCFVVMGALSWLWHGPILGDYYGSLLGPELRGEIVVEPVAGAYVLLSVLMAAVYPRVVGDPTDPVEAWVEAVRFGAVVGLLWIVPLRLVLFGTTVRPFAPVVVDGAWHLLEQGAGGLVVALIHRGLGRLESGSGASDHSSHARTSSRFE